MSSFGTMRSWSAKLVISFLRPALKKLGIIHTSCSPIPALAHTDVGRPTEGTSARKASQKAWLKTRMQTNVWRVTLITPLPRSVAPKKVQNGTCDCG